MRGSRRPYIDFQQAKRAISVPDVLEQFGLLDNFQRQETRLAGVCPLPQHEHGPYPNPQQFKAEVKDGIWLWHCFGDCQQGGDSLELARLLTGLDHAHLRHWLAERFGERLTLNRPKAGRGSPPPQSKEEARAVRQKPQRANVTSATSTVCTSPAPIKPLRFHLKLDPTVPYLQERGLQPDTIAKYGLGLCNRGLLAGYVAIPVYDYPKGEFPVAYLGRWPGDDFDEDAGRPRYKWPSDFPKHRFVYGLAEALETPADMPLIVVEGPFSVYHLVQCGFPSAVAIFGSSLSDEQAGLLADTGRMIVLMLDADEAGQNGATDGVARLVSHTFVRRVPLPIAVPVEELRNEDLEGLLCDSVSR